MIHKMFTIHDIAADAHLPPFVLPKEQLAIRTFSDCINSEDHQFGAHPDHYTLFEIATFDDETGTVLPYTAKKSLGNGVDFVAIKEDPLAMEGDSDGTIPSTPQVGNGSSIQPSPTGEDSSE